MSGRNLNNEIERVHELVSQLCEQGYEPERAAELNALLRSAPELIEPCVEYLDVHSHMMTQAFWPLAMDAEDQDILNEVFREAVDAKRLHEAEKLAKRSWERQQQDEAERVAQRQAESKESGPIVIVIPRVAVFAAAAMVLIAGAIGLSVLFSEDSPPGSAMQEPEEQTPAPAPVVLAKAVDTRWAGTAPLPGKPFDIEVRYSLDSGMALLAFGEDETVVVEAPAAFTLTGDRRLALHAGQVVARAEPGFAIETEQALIVDLGTAFGVSVEPAGRITTHVFEGKVRLENLGTNSGAHADRAAVEIDAGAAVAVNDAGTVTPVELDPQSFLTAAKLDIYAQAAAGSAYHQWLVSSYELQRDPDMIAYYLFDQADTKAGRLVNQARSTRGRLDGVLGHQHLPGSEPEAVSGRWGHNGAMRFEAGEQDLVRVAAEDARVLNGLDQLTIGVWVKPDQRNQVSHHLVTKRGQGVNALNLVMVWEGFNKGVYRRNALLFHSDLGGTDYPGHQSGDDSLHDASRWTHIAVTFDRGERRFYADGELIAIKPRAASGRLPELEADLLIGAALVHLDDPRTYLDGDIDELFMLGRVMSAEQIYELYEQGVPKEQQ